jgi:transposase InsO family protein
MLFDDFPPFICNSCEYAKTTRKPICKEHTAPPAQTFGEEVHTDVWGPSPTLSLGGRRYYVTFTDDHTRFTRLDVLRTKDETFGAYKSFAAWAQTQHNARIKQLRSDRGGEFTSNAFTDFLQKQGTERRLTTHDTPQHNGVAESLNHRLMEHTRAILHQAGLPKNLWAKAIHFAIWLKNRTSTKALGSVTPFERLYGEKPDLGNVPEWGQQVWVHSSTGSKLDTRGLQARWVGYDADSTHAHRVYWPEKNSISVERDVKFVSPFTSINILPLSYASTMMPARAPPAPGPGLPPAIAPVPPAQLATQPVPAQPPSCATSAPPRIFMPPPAPPLPPVTPPSTPVMPTRLIGEEDEVEQTITLRHITVPTSPASEHPGLRRSGRVTHVPGYYRQLQEGEDIAEHLDYVFFAGFGDIAADAACNTDDVPTSVEEA